MYFCICSVSWYMNKNKIIISKKSELYTITKSLSQIKCPLDLPYKATFPLLLIYHYFLSLFSYIYYLVWCFIQDHLYKQVIIAHIRFAV